MCNIGALFFDFKVLQPPGLDAVGQSTQIYLKSLIFLAE
jgi:hypothetical protein